MSDVMHQSRLTPTQRAALDHRAKFRAHIAAQAYKPPVVVSIKQIEPVSEPVRIVWISPEERAFGPIVCDQPKPVDVSRPSCADVIKATAQYFAISKIDMLSARRQCEYALARHVAMFLCHQLTLKSYPFIGRQLGDRDHTTVMHGCRKIHGDILSNDPITISAVDTITAQFQVDQF